MKQEHKQKPMPKEEDASKADYAKYKNLAFSVLSFSAFLAWMVSMADPAAATGYTMNGTIADLGPLLDDTVALMPSIMGLAIAVAPILIAFALINFFSGFFSGIVSRIRRF